MGRRRGLTLLELVIASSLMTTVVTATAVVLRGLHQAWRVHDADASQFASAQAALRQMVRKIRQATGVTAITAATNGTGSLSVTTPAGQTYVWQRDGGTSEVLCGVTTANGLLAEAITDLRFTGYAADGATPTTVVADIQAVRCQVTVVLPRAVNATRVVSSWAWLRSF